nr:MAG TPA: minor structural protein [Caudoviricetes sp.]
MSSATATRTIKFISKAGTYSAVIMCPEGDLYQEWEGTINDVTRIYPDFAVTKPILYFVCTSSRVAEGIATPDSIDYYFNGTKISFSGDTSTGTFAGLFKKVAPAGDNLYYGLQIVGNIAAASGYAPAVIRMVAKISYGTQSDDIQADYTIPIQQATGTSYRVTIGAGDNKNFVITEKGGSVILKALAYQAGTALSANLTYQWEKMGAGGWSVLSGKTAQTLTVAEADIDTYGEFRVTVYRDGAEIGKDIQGVMDASDPYDIEPHPMPEDETITEDTNGNGQVTYTPVVVKRGTNTPALTTPFYFIIKDAVGNYLNAGEMNTAKSSCTVTRAHCVQASGDVSITIIAQN